MDEERGDFQQVIGPQVDNSTRGDICIRITPSSPHAEIDLIEHNGVLYHPNISRTVKIYRPLEQES